MLSEVTDRDLMMDSTSMPAEYLQDTTLCGTPMTAPLTGTILAAESSALQVVDSPQTSQEPAGTHATCPPSNSSDHDLLPCHCTENVFKATSKLRRTPKIAVFLASNARQGDKELGKTFDELHEAIIAIVQVSIYPLFQDQGQI